MKRTILLAVAALALMGMSRAPAQQARQLSIATDGTGGIYASRPVVPRPALLSGSRR